MSGLGSHNYTDLNSTLSPTTDKVVSLSPSTEGASCASSLNNKKLSKLSNLAILVGVIALVGAFAFTITRSQQTTGSRASIGTLVNADSATIPQSLAFMTVTVKNYPKTYNGKTIPQSIYNEANESYKGVEQQKLKNYVINRVVLYYIMRDVLKENEIPFTDIGDNPTFSQIESALPDLKKEVDENLLSSADFAFIKAYHNYFNNDQQAREKFGDNIQPKAMEIITNYRDELLKNRDNPQIVIDKANSDADLSLLTNGEQAKYITNYFADLNNVADQGEYIYDEEFDDLLFQMREGDVSPVIGLNSQSPYMYVVVYPTKISIKKYQSLKDIVSQRLPLVQ